MNRIAASAILVSSVALASPAPNTHRVSALLIPMDLGAESKSLKLEGYMNDALAEFPTVILRKSDDLFGLPPDDQGEISLKHAEDGYQQAKIAFEATQYDDAERKLRAALHEYQKAASALKDTNHYCDALAIDAAVALQRGDVEEAKLVLLDLVSLNANYELSPKRFSREFIQLRAQVAGSRNANLRGNITVKSKPSGARIYVDGEFVGYTPQTVNTLPTGKHLLRVERPGFKQFGELVEVSPEDQEFAAELHPTSAYRAYDALLDKVASEISREKPGAAVAQLGRALGLDRAIVGTVKEINETGGVELTVGLFDMVNGGKKLSAKRIIFQGEEFGQLKSEVSRVVNFLLNAADGPNEKVVSSDPLDSKAGMEDWGGDDKGGHTEQKTKKARYKDPLDTVNGTEDW